MRPLLTLIVALAFCTPALAAEDPTRVAARAELEQELTEQMAPQRLPARIEVYFRDTDSEEFQLMESRFWMDALPLPQPPKNARASGEGSILFLDSVTPGRHVFSTELVYRASVTSGNSAFTRDYRYRVHGSSVLNGQRGLRVVLHARIAVDKRAGIGRRLEFETQIEGEMEAPLADAPAFVSTRATPHAVEAVASKPAHPAAPVLAQLQPDEIPVASKAKARTSNRTSHSGTEENGAVAGVASKDGASDDGLTLSQRKLKVLLERARHQNAVAAQGP